MNSILLDFNLDFLEKCLTELAKNAPLFVVVIITFGAIIWLYKSSLKANKELTSTAIESLKDAYDKSTETLRKACNTIIENYKQ